MNLIEAIILGLVQGLTEFLPVSSSGHLVLVQNLLRLETPGVTLEVLLHFGTLLSVLVVFWRDFTGLLQFRKDLLQRRILLMLLVGLLPTAAAAFLFGPVVETLFQSTLVVGLGLLVTGTALKMLSFFRPQKIDFMKMRFPDALWVGLLQGVAIIPGISRSGATITAALWRGLDRKTAVRYSFMLAAPVIFGATLLELKGLFGGGLEKGLLLYYAAGSLVSFLSGIAAIKIFIRLLQQRRFHLFAYYCWGVGVLVIVLYLAGML